MSELPPIVAPAAPAASAPAKASKKKRSSSRPKNVGGTLSDNIVKFVAASKDRGGVSLVALKKYLATTGYDVLKNKSRLKMALKSLLTRDILVHAKGTGNGCSGSFKMNKEVKKTQAAAAKKPTVKKTDSKKSPKKAKKPTPKKKPAAKKSPAKKPAAKKSPAKKPAAKKSPAKKPAAKKSVAKKSPAKKPAAKKPAAKKPAPKTQKKAAPKKK